MRAYGSLRKVEELMDWGYILLITTSFSTLLILAQRAHPSKKRLIRGFIVSMAILLMIRYELQGENLLAYFFALLISFLFWLLIGRYNPSNTEKEIRVFGMDD